MTRIHRWLHQASEDFGGMDQRTLKALAYNAV